MMTFDVLIRGACTKLFTEVHLHLTFRLTLFKCVEHFLYVLYFCPIMYLSKHRIF